MCDWQIGYMQSVVSEIMKIGDTKTVDGKLSLNEIIAHAKDFGSDIHVSVKVPIVHDSLLTRVFADFHGESRSIICQRCGRSSKLVNSSVCTVHSHPTSKNSTMISSSRMLLRGRS
jgi:ribosomal protein L37E